MANRIKQLSVMRIIERALKKSKEFKGDDPGVTEFTIQQQITHLESRFVEFGEIQDNIESVCGNDEVEIEFGTRAQYVDETNSFHDALEPVVHRISPPVDTHLPKIKLPVFNGDYTNWVEFENLFLDLIHKNLQLTNSQKLHYLKANLTGDAANLLKSVQISDANYDEAWRILVDRYNHRRFIIDSHLRKFKGMSFLKHESASGLRQIIDTSTDTVRCLRVLGVHVTEWDIILVNIIAEKLDPEKHRQWELSLTRSQYPTYNALIEFLNTRWQSLEMIAMTKSESPQSSSSLHQNSSSTSSYRSGHQRRPELNTARSLITTSSSRESATCPFCAQIHNVFKCEQFNSLSYEQKSNWIREKGLCFNCLRHGHRSFDCKSSLCRVCNRRHHTCLHNASTTNTISSNIKPEQAAQTNAIHVTSPFTDVLLATAIVIITHENQEFIVRALLDSGSQISCISENTANRIGLRRKPASVRISGIGASEATTSYSMVEFGLKSRFKSTWSTSCDALVIKYITGVLPSQTIDTQQWSHLDKLELADPRYYHPNCIDILLGADVIGMLQSDGYIKGINGSPFAQNTKLGYILFGKLERKFTNDLSSFAVTIDYADTMDEIMKAFWEIEEVSSIREPTHDEMLCEGHVESTHFRTKEGRYTVFLPFNDDDRPLGKSREQAIMRLKQMENRFLKNPKLRAE